MLHVIAPPGTSQEGLEKCLELLMSETCAQLRFSKIDFTFTGDQTMTAPVKPSKQRPPADGELVFWRENITNRSSGRNRKESRNGCDRIRFPVAA